MTAQFHNIPPNEGSAHIQLLSETAINQIAAGEVVERPASAVKELVENAIDAKAMQIEVLFEQGGKARIKVTDDGHGIARDQLSLAVTRHATSKIDGSDLVNIHSFGFRGEALPSLGAVGRLTITSRVEGQSAAAIDIEGGQTGPVRDAAGNFGTTVDLRDLFYATPARLKFMRSDSAETRAIVDVVKRLAMAEPHISFRVIQQNPNGTQTLFQADPESGALFDQLEGRLRGILGPSFLDNSVRIECTREPYWIGGFTALPTHARGSAVHQYVFVNGRPVRDKALLGAARAAYSDLLSRNRYPAFALFIEVPPETVDINVHPAKAEVRFKDAQEIRALVITGIRNALSQSGPQTSSHLAQAMAGMVTTSAPQTPAQPSAQHQTHMYQFETPSARMRQAAYQIGAPAATFEPAPSPMSHELHEAPAPFMTAPPETKSSAPPPEQSHDHFPLGAAVAQIHENYILAQTQNGMVIVDQHAAHERLVYERLKSQLAQSGVKTQALLIPEVIDLNTSEKSALMEAQDKLAGMGLVIEEFGPSAVAVQETPAILGQFDVQALMADVIDTVETAPEALLESRIFAVLSRISCHGSVRSGRRMTSQEMNALLRDIETTPNASQCNHGRPTFIELALGDIEKLFGRT